ncbi:hypothetical protein [Actinophytocola sp.]|uniref:hypothetical protein n=1 Tax=Actinophytocola sp. TaxID=1872138 RepID=UPI002D7E8120|nr:hypothetical protein [Actinophytocola sp.]HET9142166.1 hypothetical protein [Actinophytocola sp.]HEU5108548.1 hypothetical protein [Micromonosporaceae bacterium]
MDERKLNELFRDAVPDAPPPSFDHTDVAMVSHRQQARLRRSLLGGSALAAVILVGVAVFGMALWNGAGTREGTSSGQAASAPMADSATGNAAPVPNEVPNEGADSDKKLSAEPSKQGDAPTEIAGPSGPGSTPSGCVKADLELAAALAGELQAADTSVASSELPAGVACPPDGRGAAYRLADGGLISVLLVSPTSAQPNPFAGKPDGTAVRAQVTPRGLRLMLVSEPGPGSRSAPLESRLQTIAERLAGKF